MPCQPVDEATFLAKFTDLFDRNRDKGSVYFHLKRFQGRWASIRRHHGKRQEEAAKGHEPECLARAYTNVKGTKIRTIIPLKDIARFQLAVGNIIRSNMDGLKRPAPKDKAGEAKTEKKKRPRTRRRVKKDAPTKNQEAATTDGEAKA